MQFLTLHRPGTVNVTAKAVASSGYSESDDIVHQLTVFDDEPVATSLTLNANEIDGAIGTKHRLVAHVAPMNASDLVTWHSLNPNVASVDDIGFVTINGYGETAIVSSTSDGSNLTAECLIRSTDQSAMISEIEYSSINISTENEQIVITNLPIGIELSIVTLNGQVICSKMATSDVEKFILTPSHTYIVKIGLTA